MKNFFVMGRAVAALLIVSLLSSCAVSARVRMEDGVMRVYLPLAADQIQQHLNYESQLTGVTATELQYEEETAGGRLASEVGYAIGVGLGLLVLAGVAALIGLLEGSSATAPDMK